ncbi:serine hydrolase domain-containing protein [Motilimonas eburnea]|uniref:serine hydrolase domain-containing protein n=1 Tax=Motilimonas eburnea TaxID=1737488 RepID=UPI001E2869FF|nr:beta-lactamase family protein [Motilimonas eburnea]
MKYLFLFALLFISACATKPPQVYNTSPITMDAYGRGYYGGHSEGQRNLQQIPTLKDTLTTAQKRALDNFTAYASRDNNHALGGMVVYHKGVPVYSWFDTANGAVSNETYQTNSLTKSVTSLLLGIAIDQGFIKSVDDPAARYLGSLSQYFTGAKANITIKDLLTMTDAISWNQQLYKSDGSINTNNSIDKMFYASNPARYVASLPANSNATGSFAYGEWQPFLIGQIIQNATQTNLFDFAQQHLFTPMGIQYWHWHTFGGNSSPNTNGGVYLTVWDRAKLGQMLLDQGKWQGKQIVSQQWVAQSTQNQLAKPWSAWAGSSYGYYWWLNQYNVGQQQVSSISALGWGGNSIIVYPERDLVIATMGGDYDSSSMAGFELNEYLAKRVVTRYF